MKSRRSERNDGWVCETAFYFVLPLMQDSRRYQQNLAAIGIAVVLLTRVRNRMQDLRPLVPRVLQVLQNIRKGELAEIAG